MEISYLGNAESSANLESLSTRFTTNKHVKFPDAVYQEHAVTELRMGGESEDRLYLTCASANEVMSCITRTKRVPLLFVQHQPPICAGQRRVPQTATASSQPSHSHPHPESSRTSRLPGSRPPSTRRRSPGWARAPVRMQERHVAPPLSTHAHARHRTCRGWKYNSCIQSTSS